ncbi:Catabolic L-serine/threonine dehydratase [Fulvia fulva]|nr:Catabolic L-serine/threonine dehydratase [Fulvia fulva]WPV19208.1 Catabolic L-serine/threonine dehydratase [Fulvia fulva]WPV33956.1 Catabolic L-serine/threonine dehydratase [Fulvia fulva]
MGAQRLKIPPQQRPWRQTPLIESVNLSKAAGCRIFLKLDNLQPSGSFKSRGLGNLVIKSMERAEDPDKVHFFSNSGGNAALGCISAGKFVGRPVTVVTPMSTKPHMISKLYAAGAKQVIQYGPGIKEAGDYMRQVVIPKAVERGEEPIYVSPFDHPDIWDGHSTMVDEMQQQFCDLGEDAPDWVICSSGGGGLFIGLMQGIEDQGPTWDKTKVLTCGTHGADALTTSLAKGENTTLPKITSIATSLGVARVSDRAFELAVEGRASGKVKNTVLTDAEAAMGCWRFAEDERLLVEPACGVNIALCYGNRLKKALGRPVRPDEKVVIVVCGGSNVSTAIVEGWREVYGDVDCVNGYRRDSLVASDGIAPDWIVPMGGHASGHHRLNEY